MNIIFDVILIMKKVKSIGNQENDSYLLNKIYSVIYLFRKIHKKTLIKFY